MICTLYVCVLQKKKKKLLCLYKKVCSGCFMYHQWPLLESICSSSVAHYFFFLCCVESIRIVIMWLLGRWQDGRHAPSPQLRRASVCMHPPRVLLLLSKKKSNAGSPLEPTILGCLWGWLLSTTIIRAVRGALYVASSRRCQPHGVVSKAGFKGVAYSLVVVVCSCHIYIKVLPRASPEQRLLQHVCETCKVASCTTVCLLVVNKSGAHPVHCQEWSSECDPIPPDGGGALFHHRHRQRATYTYMMNEYPPPSDAKRSSAL